MTRSPVTSSQRLLLTHNSPVCRRNYFLGARRQLHSGFLGFGVVGDDGGVVPGGARQLPAVTGLLLQAAHDGALGHGAHGQDIPDVQLSCKEQGEQPKLHSGPGPGLQPY